MDCFGKEAPHPVLVEKGGKFFARWSRDDALMRSRRRSVLELPDRTDAADDAFLAALRSDDGIVRWRVKQDIRELGVRLAAWYRKRDANPEACRQVVFRLSPPDSEDGGGMWRLALDAGSLSAAELAAAGSACRIYAPLRGMADAELELSQSEAEAFLRSGAPALKAAGYGVEIPEGMAAEVDTEAQFVPQPAPESGEDPGADGKVKTKITVRVAGQKVSRAEIEFLLEQGSSLVFFRGHWIEIDRNVLKSALKAMGEDGASMSAREAFSFALGFRRPRGVKAMRVKGTGWFGRVLEELRAGGGFKLLPRPKGFRGRLRTYQRRGFSWISYLSKCGFGALLADDMGLGKTVQTIAWMLARKEQDPGCGRVLIVSPVSVTLNWMREIGKFAPKMKVLLHHGRQRLAGGSFEREVARYDAVVVGYPLFVKEHALLAAAGFSAIVLDEAQKIKNPDTRVARAARSFPAEDRLALTGTPFENSVMDIWSIEEFLNSGLLGPRREFANDFECTDGDSSSPRAFAELKKILAPFLLRRLKNDPGIAAEIGPKREVREYCALSPRQRAAYETALARYAYAPRGQGGRDGRALALLTELKLVCDGLDASGELSGGKADLLVELLETVFESGESALIFTQYVKVGEKLKQLLEAKFARRVPFLYGGLPAAEREARIAGFNASAAPTAFILSLKAGGFGLNLTKATHVIHYDRWWNPAVENQATDRAHRIGQSRPVLVHLFMCHGTLEDRIDEMLEAKREVAGELVVSGESFLMKMGEEEFARTVRLS